MKPSLQWSAFLLLSALWPAYVHAQLAKQEPALVAMYGAVSSRAKETINFENRLVTIGERIFFAGQPWRTSALMVDGQCVRMYHTKDGSWEAREIRLLFDRNGGYSTFTEKPTDGIRFRTWTRRDGIEAQMRGGDLKITHPLYERRLAALRAEAKTRPKS